MMEKPLNPRQKQVLTAIVDHYIVKAEPVSSQLLSRNASVRASSATIRNTMAELEDMGMVEQPHTSSGRLPTDLGYRTYVDDLMHPEPLREEDRHILEQALARDESDEACMAHAAKTLADMTQLLGLVIPPSGDEAVFRKISLIPADEGKVVVVLTSSEDEARSLLVEPGNEASVFRLESIAHRLNQQMLGKPVSFLNDHLEKPENSIISSDDSKTLEMLNRSILKLSRTQAREDVFLYGTRSLVNRPDFVKIEDIGSVLELLDSKVTLVHFLRQRCESEGVHVTVGEERHEDGKLFRELSLVTSAFSWGGGQGMVGVLGPKRMPYARLVPVVEHAAKVLSRKHGNTHGNNHESENA
jgi:heat-inducible transcriptional repressor